MPKLMAPTLLRNQLDYFFLPATCFAAMAWFLFCRSLFALVCFCVACLFTALGDLSPMVSCLSSDGLFTCGVLIAPRDPHHASLRNTLQTSKRNFPRPIA